MSALRSITNQKDMEELIEYIIYTARYQLNDISIFYNQMRAVIDQIIDDSGIIAPLRASFKKWRQFFDWTRDEISRLDNIYELYKRYKSHEHIIGTEDDIRSFRKLFNKYLRFFMKDDWRQFWEQHYPRIKTWWQPLIDDHVLDRLLTDKDKTVQALFQQNLTNLLTILNALRLSFMVNTEWSAFQKIKVKIIPILDKLDRMIILRTEASQKQQLRRTNRRIRRIDIRLKRKQRTKQKLLALLRNKGQDVPFDDLLARFQLLPKENTTAPAPRQSKTISVPVQTSVEDEIAPDRQPQVQALKQRLRQLHRALRHDVEEPETDAQQQTQWEWRHKVRPDIDPQLQHQLRARKQANWPLIVDEVRHISEQLFHKYRDCDTVVIVDVQNIWKQRGQFNFKNIQRQLRTDRGREQIKREFYDWNKTIDPRRCGWIFVTQGNLSATGERIRVQEMTAQEGGGAADDRPMTAGDTIIRVACTLPPGHTKNCYDNDIPFNPMDDMVILNLSEKFRSERTRALRAFDRKKARLAQSFQDTLSQLQRTIRHDAQSDYVDLAIHKLFKDDALKHFYKSYHQLSGHHLPPEEYILSFDNWNDAQRVAVHTS